jgi:hypothetical protein
MLQFYYTGATAPTATQPDPSRSLGGYVSGSPLEDDVLNNLFGDITPMGMQYAGPETYALGLRNLGPKGAQELKLGYVYPAGCAVRLEVAAVELYADSCNKLTMQALASRRARPQGATFHELEMRRATAELAIEFGPDAGDVLHLLVDGVQITPAETVRSDMSATTAASFLAQQILTRSTEYFAEVDPERPNVVKITRELPGPFTGTLELDTDGTAYAESVTFANGLDNSASLGNLAKGEILGLWFRRTLLPSATQPIPAAELEKLPVGNRHREDLEIYLSYEDEV